MKLIVTLFILICSLPIFSKDFITDKDGALLWAENCMGCHIPQNFLAAVPTPEYVDELIEDIDYNIYDPESGMNFLEYLKVDEIKKIARFLIYGAHSDKFINEGLHGFSATEFGSENCLKCHDNFNFYKEPPLSCNVCH